MLYLHKSKLITFFIGTLLIQATQNIKIPSLPNIYPKIAYILGWVICFISVSLKCGKSFILGNRAMLLLASVAGIGISKNIKEIPEKVATGIYLASLLIFAHITGISAGNNLSIILSYISVVCIGVSELKVIPIDGLSNMLNNLGFTMLTFANSYRT